MLLLADVDEYSFENAGTHRDNSSEVSPKYNKSYSEKYPFRDYGTACVPFNGVVFLSTGPIGTKSGEIFTKM